MAPPQPLVDACVAFARRVSPEAVAHLIALLDARGVEQAGHGLGSDAARDYAALVATWRACESRVAPSRLADILQGAAAAIGEDRQLRKVELVWSGPHAPSSTLRSTAPALLELIGNARHCIYLVTFAAYRVPEVAAALAEAVRRGVRLVFVLESDAAGGGKVRFDPLPHLAAGQQGAVEVYSWPIEQRPKDAFGRHGTLHAKFAVGDRQQLFVSSANLTEFAFNLNVELGVLLTGGTAPVEAAEQLEQMIRRRVLLRCPN